MKFRTGGVTVLHTARPPRGRGESHGRQLPESPCEGATEVILGVTVAAGFPTGAGSQ